VNFPAQGGVSLREISLFLCLNLLIMVRLLASALLAGAVLLDSVWAGRFSDITHGRAARSEIAYEAEQSRKLESRGGNKGRYLSNATLREYFAVRRMEEQC
jgi:hypothetical protein